MTQRSVVGWMVVFVLMLSLPAWAIEYRFQVANLDFLTVSAYTDRSQPGQPGEGSLRRLEMRLDTMEFPASAVIPGRDVLLLQDPAYGGRIPDRVAVLPTTREQAWTTFVWDANPGDRVVFVVKSDMSAWQEAWFIAANPEGTLRRLSLGGPSWFGRRSYEVPQVSYDFLANAVDRGTFPSWMAEHAKSLNGMSIAIGRGRDRFNRPDRVYVVLQLPAEPRTFKAVIGWRDYSDRGTENQPRMESRVR
jgi:hypothetical protein